MADKLKIPEKQISFRLSIPVYRKFKSLVSAEGRFVNDVLLDIINFFLQNNSTRVLTTNNSELLPCAKCGKLPKYGLAPGSDYPGYYCACSPNVVGASDQAIPYELTDNSDRETFMKQNAKENWNRIQCGITPLPACPLPPRTLHPATREDEKTIRLLGFVQQQLNLHTPYISTNGVEKILEVVGFTDVHWEGDKLMVKHPHFGDLSFPANF